MEKTIAITRTCNLGFEQVADRIEADPAAVLQPAARAAATRSSEIVLDLDSHWAWFDVHETVTAEIGELQRAISRATLPLQWDANKHKRLLPAVTGHLRIDAMSHKHTEITYVGEYQPPDGLFTDVSDRVLGRRIIEAAIGHLLDQVVENLEAPRPVATATT